MTNSSPKVPGRGRGRPPRLTQDQIVDAARIIVQREGFSALTMRRLAESIGSTPMALYGHVDDKDDLILLILDAEAQEMEWPELPDQPRDRIIVAATFIHATLVDRPWALEATWPGELFALAVLPLAEAILAAFVESGLTTTAAAHAYRSVWFLITGEVRARHHPTGSVAKSRLTRINPETTPYVDAFASGWQDTNRTYDVTHAITVLVDGLLEQRLIQGS